MSKIKRRLFLYFTNVSLFLAGTAFLVFVTFLLLYHVIQDEKDIRTQGEMIQEYVKTNFHDSSDIHKLSSYMAALDYSTPMEIFFIQGRGEDFSCSCGCGCIPFEREPSSEILQFSKPVFESGEYTFVRQSSPRHFFLYYAGIPVPIENRTAAVIILQNETKFAITLFFYPVLLLFICILVTLPFSSVFSSRMATAFLLPLQQIMQTVTELTKGNYDARTQVVDSTEIGSLARETDFLAVKLAEAQERTNNRAREQKEFFATISHELRTPVAVICSYSAALKDGVLPENRRNEYYEQLYSESLSLKRLVNDMLELSRLESSDFSIEMNPVDIGMILEDTVRSSSLLASQKQLKIVYNSPGEEIMTIGDYGRLKQMFMIVIDNAMKYSEAGQNIKIIAQKLEGQYRISIQDEGPGLTEEEQERVFQRFYSTSDNGSGLGMVIMKNIAKRHNIDVSLLSSPGVGTTVTFLIPDVNGYSFSGQD